MQENKCGYRSDGPIDWQFLEMTSTGHVRNTLPVVFETAGFRPATGLSDWQDSLLSQAARKQVWQSLDGAARTQQVTVTDVHKNAGQCETFVKWHSYVACIKSSLCKTGVTFMETRVVDLNKQSNQCVNLRRPAENMFHPKIKTKKKKIF